MRLYFAGYSTDKEIFEVKEAKFLLESYLLFKNKNYVEWHKQRNLMDRKLFLDSGAFSAFTQNSQIDIDKYISFIKEYKDNIEVYATLDKIGDWEGTRKNLEYMESHGLTPLPVFHHGSPLHELERLCKQYDYIALGGLVPLSMQRQKLKSWLDTCFSIIMKTNPKMKIHGFGVNAFWAWERYPFYSVDATSWLMGGKFRRIIKFVDGKIIAYNKRVTKNSVEKVEAYKSHYTELNRANVLEYLKAEQFITRLWEGRGISWD